MSNLHSYKNEGETKKTKKIKSISLIIAIILILVLFVSCNKDGDKKSSNETTTTTSGEPTEVTDPTETDNSDPEDFENKFGWVSVDSLWIRGGPSGDFGVEGGLSYGERVTILDKEGDWYKIRRLQLEGYVSAQYISLEPIETKNGESGTTVGTTSKDAE